MAKFIRKQNETSGRDASSIRVASSTYQKAVLKKLLSQLMLAFMVILVVYLCFAATIIRFVPSDAGLVLLKNNTYPGGQLPAGANVLIGLNPDKEVKGGVLDRLQQGFLPQDGTAVVQVLAGPSGKLNWVEPGILTVNGKALDVPFPVEPDFDYLAETNPDGTPGLEYVAVCVKGACEPDTPVFFRANNVYGVPVSKDNFDSSPDWDKLKDADRARPTAETLATFLVESGKVTNEKKAPCVGEAMAKSELSDDLLSRAVADIDAISDAEFATFDGKADEAIKGCKAGATGGKN